jgi:hypothetical protein
MLPPAFDLRAADLLAAFHRQLAAAAGRFVTRS